MRKLLKGIVDFREKYHSHYVENFSHLALGQFPDTLFIACSDSRVVPNLFASTNPGDLFVIRNVGNMIPPFTISSACLGTAEAAAIEFSLTNLPITNIIVCGHSECAAMKAMVTGVDKIEDPFLKTWLSNYDCPIDPLKAPLIFDEELSLHNKVAQMNILQQIDHIKGYPIVKKRIKKGDLQVHGWYFDIGKGDIYGYEQEFKKFVLIDEVEAKRICDRLDQLEKNPS
jgi:carbonic anhydrase